jgi:hypothetical protein
MSQEQQELDERAVLLKRAQLASAQFEALDEKSRWQYKMLQEMIFNLTQLADAEAKNIASQAIYNEWISDLILCEGFVDLLALKKQQNQSVAKEKQAQKDEEIKEALAKRADKIANKQFSAKSVVVGEVGQISLTMPEDDILKDKNGRVLGYVGNQGCTGPISLTMPEDDILKDKNGRVGNQGCTGPP